MTDVFKATYKDQYAQDIYLKPGTYTFQALVLFQTSLDRGRYSISFTDQDDVVYNINLNWQIEPNIWCEVSQTIELEKTMVKFSLMASDIADGETVLIGLPQHEEGNTKSTPRANPLDENETLKDEIDLVRTYISSQVDILEDRIVLKVGEYQIGGKNFLRNFDGRFGTDFWAEGVELVDENGDSIPVYILSVTAPNPISVYVNSTPEVPETVKLVLDNGSSVNVPVDWGVIDTSVVGEQSIQGTYELPEGVTGDMPEVVLKVLVTALTVVSVTPLTQVTVDQYRVPSLPTTIQLNLNNQTSIDVPVTWGAYSTNTAGTFELTAVYDLPTGVSGYKPAAKITLVVNAVVDTGTFINLKQYLTNLVNSGTDEMGSYVTHAHHVMAGALQHFTGNFTVYVRHKGSAGINPILYAATANKPWDHNTDQKIILSTDKTQTSKYFTTDPMDPFTAVHWRGYTNIKIYNLELRNDGSVPPWYIE